MFVVCVCVRDYKYLSRDVCCVLDNMYELVTMMLVLASLFVYSCLTKPCMMFASLFLSIHEIKLNMFIIYI